MIHMFYEAIAADLRKSGIDAVTVVDVDERTIQGGYCDTCAYEFVGMDVTYVDSKGKRKYETIEESFVNYIRRITN